MTNSAPNGPAVRDYMTANPHSIREGASMAEAHKIMRQHHIRHLPVRVAGKLVGIVTERDLHLLETLKDVDPERVPVEEAMSQEVYVVEPDEPIDQVAAKMAHDKLGSALVVHGDDLQGIFTTVDALRALVERSQR